MSAANRIFYPQITQIFADYFVFHFLICGNLCNLWIKKDPGSDYGVSIPDLPGCISAGTTLDEALEAAKDAIECHIEGMLIDGEPVPAGGEVDRYREDPEWADGIWGLVQVDLSKLSGKSGRVNITLPDGYVSFESWLRFS